MPKGRFWSDEELEFLTNNYGKITTTEIAKKLARTEKSIHRKAFKLNLSFDKTKIGDKFGRLTIIEEPFSVLHNGKYRYMAKVICDCLNKTEKILPLSYLKSGKTKSCGCLRIELCTGQILRVQENNSQLFFNAHPCYKGYKKLSLTNFNRIINNALCRDLELNPSLTIEVLYELLEQQNWRCALTGIQIGFKTRYYDSNDKNTASLDRINSLLGYFLENVRWIHKIINGMKWQYPDSHFIDCCKNVALFSGILEPYKYIYSNHGSRWKGYGDVSQWYYNSLIYGAKKRNLEFNIDIIELWELFLSQNCRCNLTGEPIFFGEDYSRQITSLDRIDNSKGYTIDNVQWVDKFINKFRNNMSISDFKFWCKLIYDYKNKIPNEYNGL